MQIEPHPRRAADELGSDGRNAYCGNLALPPREIKNVSATGTDPTESQRSARSDPYAPGLRNRARFLADLFVETGSRFVKNDGFRLGAAFSYYATFSIFPLLLLSTTFVGFLLGDSTTARERLLDAISIPNSPVRDVLDRSMNAMQSHQAARGISAFVGVVTLLFAASGAFVELDAALNRIWRVPPRQATTIFGSLRLLVLERLSGIAIVFGLGVTLLVSLVSSSFLTYLTDRAREQVATPLWPALVRTAELVLSLVVISAMFTAVFHLIPRTHPPVRSVLGGAVLTTVLLLIAKEIFATYLANVTRYAAYGVVGGFLALTTWIYASSMLIFFGAQLTEVHAEKLARGAASS
ncbi:MAG TPA: YihY/virulence factor BrkB family protein [Labilithrix sp.]|nr:YihY/virulence factor BrkB family protein [Labilithrix sp.]